MDAREYITKWRTARKLTTDEVAKSLSISARLLEEVEGGGFTHPKIAVRMKEFFGLTDDETSQLVSPNHVDDVLKHLHNLRKEMAYYGTQKTKSRSDREYRDYMVKRAKKVRNIV